MARFTPEFLDEIRARLRVSDVVGRSVKLQKRGNAWWGLSPFKKEKTPSFSVDDNRQSYHCFATGKHGDIIRFLMEVKGLTFPEAVEQLAEEAGLDSPKENPRAAEEAEKRKGLQEASEAAAVFFQSMLRRAQGRQAADYLKNRGLDEKTIDDFRIGFAPNERTALKDYLINKGFHDETLVEAGLVIKPDDGGASYDRFRGRVMFAITGPRDQVIAFGGRALDPNAHAKYLNSPETPLFHKGNVLYNLNGAREAAAKSGESLIVAEGYMDVIAIVSAGFKTAVAPLGTALTENQLSLLWRQSDEPVLCFDGDSAGLSAAYRSVDRALGMLKPGKSLRFAFMAEGADPDDLIRARGADAFAEVLEKAEPLASVLWRREIEARPLDTPERRAALRSGLRALVKTIADKDVRQAYGAEFAGRLQAMFSARPQSAERRGAGRPWTPPSVGRQGQRRGVANPFRREADARASADLKRQGAPSAYGREATLILAAIRHPELVSAQEEAFLALRLTDHRLDGLLKALLAALFADHSLDSEGVKAHLLATPAAGILQRILHDETLNRQRFLRPGAELDEVEWGWRDALRHHLLATDARRDVSESASQALADGEDVWKAAVMAREELVNSGDLGAGLDRDDENKKDLGALLERMKASVSEKRKKD